MTGGTYTLLVELPAAATVEVGALGTLSLDAGWYAYAGSALGPGGFSRVERHQRVAAGDHEVRHWHVDYLLGHPSTRLARVVRSPGADAECAVARALSGEHVPGFGASDCDCASHLVHAPERGPLERSVESAHDAVRGD